MQSNRIRRAVGTFPNHAAAERALTELRDSGFPMDKVSVVAKDTQHHDRIAGVETSDRVGNKADDGAKAGAVSGGALGGLTGLLVGLGVLAIPGIGPVMLAGAGATVLATALSGTAIGSLAGGLLGALVGLGIPEEHARGYHDRVTRGEYLVMVEGNDTDLARAEAILSHRGIEGWGIYDVPGAVAQPVETNEASVAAVRPATSETIDRAPHRDVADTEAIRLYEERLRVDKTRRKAGEVTISKQVETETTRVTVPIEKERVVVERIASDEIGKAVAPGTANFQEGEVLRVEVYEEMPDIRKETIVREEVHLHKAVDHEMVKAEETLRREELDVDVNGNPIIKGDRF